LPRRDEAALHSGYLVGRAALEDGVSMLEVVRLHHAVLLDVLDSSLSEDVRQIGSAAAEFLVEVLATYDMTHRSIPPGAGHR
ncbi:MAG TPA: phosphatase RsbU N-terminal domain-containing protein, partial [Actinomycetes bacterium]|nr:phosphatase RsbU N-terminal domain-containing protein [Actinomycetes bacterium]